MLRSSSSPQRHLHCVAAALLGAWLAGAPAAAPGAAAATEEEAVVDAASLIEPALLSGPGFSVDPHVELRGYMAHFTLDTRLGTLQAPSVEMLTEREAELPALERLDAATHSEAFVRAAGDRLGHTVESLVNIALHPVDTVTGLPVGVARYLRDRLVRQANQAQSLTDRAARKLGNIGEPFPADQGPMTQARDGDATDAPAARRKTWYTRIAREGERYVKRELKFNTVKRDIARRLGIDPYSTNPQVQERLVALAWVGSAGSFSAGAALDAVGGVGADILAKGGQIDEIVWRLSPDDLRARNATRLQAHCRDALLVRQFVRRGAFSPTLQTALVDALDALQPATGCDAFLELAMSARSELEARFLVNGLALVHSALGAHAHGGHLLTIGAGFAFRADDGELLLPLAVDRLSWTDDAARYFALAPLREGRRRVLIAGDATALAAERLAELGWRVELRAPRGPNTTRAAATADR